MLRSRHRRLHPVRHWSVPILGLLVVGAVPIVAPTMVQAATQPSSVTIAGSLQSEAGCPGDWDPTCALTHLTRSANDDVWRATFALPAGAYEYKAAINDSWTENYGLHAAPGGANIAINLAAPTSVRFYYDHASHWATSSAESVIAVAPGSFQSELGCPGDWDPSCMRSWLQDPDGDGVYSFETTALPAGTYETKVAIDEGWSENYGQGGVAGGSNISFTVPANGTKVTFTYVATTHVLTVLAGHGADNNVEMAGLRHDSRDTLYRTPGGAVAAGTPVTLRLRTFHDDATAVKLRLYDLNAGGQRLEPMTRAATDVSCYDDALAAERCDFWAVTLANGVPNNYWYRFIVTDGTDTKYYADDTAALDGGLGSATTVPVDNSWALMVYDPSFRAPAWSKNGVIYQIFPDRFRNGDRRNDPRTGDQRYADPVVKMPFGMLPEGYCRNYADAPTNCPWRNGQSPASTNPTVEQPTGRDYQGGDLKGVDQQLDYLQSLGVTTIYLNPIFDGASNHGYDTQDYTKIDPYFGTQKDFDQLVKDAGKRDMRVLLDGVFNHMSSDSPFFDRYHHYKTVGACESASSPYRSWFHFRSPVGSEPSVCAPSTPGGTDTYYDGWFGFDSIPVLTKSQAAVQQYFVTGGDSITKQWLEAGAGGWRMDVMGDPSFPPGYWEAFRTAVKTTKPSALIVSETWQKDSTLLRMLRGDRADTTMNYRFRDAVVGLLAPGPFDSKGFADSGYTLKPSQFASRISSMREDYPDAAYFSAMNLLDSHDTVRLRWALTPGTDTTADKELNTANVARGQQAVRLASLIQFTMPGQPTVYYGDEVGVTGGDDPDDRRAYPWKDQGGSPDTAMLAHYRRIAADREDNRELRTGALRVLLADDVNETLAYGRSLGDNASIVVINRSATTRSIRIPVGGYLPDGTRLLGAYGVGVPATQSLVVTAGAITVDLPAFSGLRLATRRADLTAPSAPGSLVVTNEGNASVSLSWAASTDATGYDVYGSPLTGGGYVKLNTAPVTATTFNATGLRNGQTMFFIVKGLDAVGNASDPSNEVSALPHLTIGWANLQWPPSITHTVSAVNRTASIYGQVWIDGATSQPGATATLSAEVGFGPTGSDPAAGGWTWAPASFNANAGNNDEFVASLLPEVVGTFSYVYRYSTTGGRDFVYADLNGPFTGSPPNPGVLTVASSGDTTAPDAPTNLRVLGASPGGVNLAWDGPVGDPTMYGFEVLRSSGGGASAVIALTTATTFTDLDVVEGATYTYVVRSVDLSFNRSGNSLPVSATAALRTVTLNITVTVPASTDATGKNVYIAGFLDRLDGGLPQWNPGGVSLTRVDATHWAITLTGKESTQIEYKYALGAWDFGEKDGACGEIANRQLTLSYGSTGVQTVNDTVLNWRNVSPCGN